MFGGPLLSDDEGDSLGDFMADLVGAAWRTVTYFVVPVIVVEEAGPFEAGKRSLQILKRTWGEVIGAEFGSGWIVFLVSVFCLGPLLLVGTLLGGGVLGAICFVLVVLAWLALTLVTSALDTIITAALYLYSVEGIVPQHFGEELLQGAFVKKTEETGEEESEEAGDPAIQSDASTERSKDLEGSDLANADLKEANLKEADLRGADLGGANLRSAYLEGANLEGANLKKANLRDSNLQGANLENAEMGSADLTDADLAGANLQGADLNFADFSRANIEDVDLRGVQGWRSFFSGAKGTPAHLPDDPLEE